MAGVIQSPATFGCISGPVDLNQMAKLPPQHALSSGNYPINIFRCTHVDTHLKVAGHRSETELQVELERSQAVERNRKTLSLLN